MSGEIGQCSIRCSTLAAGYSLEFEWHDEAPLVRTFWVVFERNI